MKTSNPTIFLIAIVMLAASCGSTTNQQDQTDRNIVVATIDPANIPIIKPLIGHADTAIKAQIQHIFDDYLQVQSSLAADQFHEAAVAARHFNVSMYDYPDSILPQEQKQVYEKHMSVIKTSAASIAESKNIQQQRLAFELLSGHVFELLKSFGSHKQVYQTYCAMAFDNKGASWLSDTTAIRNPYFGDEMLECGEIVAAIKKNEKQ